MIYMAYIHIIYYIFGTRPPNKYQTIHLHHNNQPYKQDYAQLRVTITYEISVVLKKENVQLATSSLAQNGGAIFPAICGPK